MLTKKDILKKIIDGQELLDPTPEQWEIMKLGLNLDEKPVDKDMLGYYDYFVEKYHKYPELLLLLGYSGRIWRFYQILMIQGIYQRVFLEKLTCPTCGWEGETANPHVIDNYIDLPKDVREEARKKAYKYPILPCPNCGSKLPRHPIWVEY